MAKRRSRTVRRAPATDRPVIIYMHGIGNQGPEKLLKQQWDLALFGREMGERTRFAYWSDILHPESSSRRTRSLETPTETEFEAADLLKEAGIRATNDRIQIVEKLAASLARSRDDDGSTNSPTVGKKVLPLPGFLRRPIAAGFLKLFVKDSAAYFFDKDKREQIKNRLIRQIPRDGAPFVLVSHSQGTVASFEVLHEVMDRPEVLHWVTIGSPLGLKEVQDLLVDQGRSLSVPSKVRSWSNFADRLDPVAADPTLSNDYEPFGFIADDMVVNARTRELRRFNPHSSIGYLSHPDVREPVHRSIGFDSSGRFIVARDVTEELLQPERRQPVLIEVLEPNYWALDESDEDLQDREEQEAKDDGQVDLKFRIERMVDDLKALVVEHGQSEDCETDEADILSKAAIMPLRKYVSARLTPGEIQEVASRHREMCVYAVWRSASKKKLINRSHLPLKADAAKASYSAMGDGIVWAVLDTGTLATHPHFHDHNGNHHTVKQVLDCTTDSPLPIPITDKDKQDPDGHGTHVSGIIAGQFEAGKRNFQGVAPRSQLIVYKVLDDQGHGYDAWIIKAIDDIWRRNESVSHLAIHGVNLSLGGPFDPTVYGCGFSPICKELRELWRQGVLVCVASGNEGRVEVRSGGSDTFINTQASIGDPANLEDCIAVGSVHADKPNLYGVSYFSSRGPTADGRIKPDVVAPGERIHSCNSRFRLDNGGYSDLYRADSGTSMACPHVSGLLAAFLSVRREFIGRPDEVKQLLLDSCNDLGRDRYHQGAGLPNLMKMLGNS